MLILKRALIAVVFALGLVAMPSRADTIASYSIVAHDPVEDATVLLVRVIVDGTESSCPSFEVNGQSVDAASRYNPDAERFPVLVCEVKADLGDAVTVAGQPAPTLADHDGGNLRLSVLGDTGCAPSDQSCADGWPFLALAAAAAAENPDLVIHIGDFDYSGTRSRRAKDDPSVYDGCVPAADKSYVSLADLSDWQTWHDDLITPAAELLQAASWVVVRDNYELCCRGGDGWFYLLDPHYTLHAVPRCDTPVVTTEPYPLSVAGLEMVVLDNSDGCYASACQDDATFAWQTREFAPLLRQAADLLEEAGGPVWFLTHRPFWSANVLESGRFFDGSDAWQLTLKATLGDALPDDVSLVLSGYVYEA